MKKVLFLLTAACLLSSCSMKTYYQVYQTKPVEAEGYETTNQNVVYADDNVTVSYDFFSEKGDASFLLTNNTEKTLYLHMDECFFVLNGMAYDYYQDRSWVKATSQTTSFTFQRHEGQSKREMRKAQRTMAGIEAEMQSGNAASAGTSATNSRSIENRERRLIIIPPHATKRVGEFTVSNEMIKLCGVNETPMGSKSSGRAFTAADSPILFSNFLTYSLGESTAKLHINNQFYVSEVTNVGEKTMIIVMRKTDVCGKTMSGKKNVVNKLNYNTPDRFYVSYRR